MTTEQLRALIETDDPVDTVWEALWEIWSPPAETLADHYGNNKEWQAIDLEETLIEIYWEFYDEVLPWRCVNDVSVAVPDDGAFVMMDAMSVREAALFRTALEAEGYDVDVGYNFSTVPSETTPFKKRIGFRDLQNEYSSATVRGLEPDLTGDERFVWSRYPDALLENIQEGKTELSSVEEAYERSEDVLLTIFEQLDADHIVIGSDHGYIRQESGFSFPINESQKNSLRDVFGNQRFIGVDEENADGLVAEKMAIEADGYYMPVGRYTWPVRGKYSVYQHGGMSLMECLTPRIEVQR